MLHRKNLSDGPSIQNNLNATERLRLAGAISMFLTQTRISSHMNTDHMFRFFTHHRAYLFGLEQFLKTTFAGDQAFIDKVVPLPFWNSTKRLPSSFDFFNGSTAVAPNAPPPDVILPPFPAPPDPKNFTKIIPGVTSPNVTVPDPIAYAIALKNYNDVVLPNYLKLCKNLIMTNPRVSNTTYLMTNYSGCDFFPNNDLNHPETYADPMALSEGLGMDFAQGLFETVTHYHGKTHAWLGGVPSPLFQEPSKLIDYIKGLSGPPTFNIGPFLNGHNTAAPFIFWPLHAFFESFYHKWEEKHLGNIVSHVFTFTNQNMPQLFILDEDGLLRHTVNRGIDKGNKHADPWKNPDDGGPNTDDPSFGNWDHWDQCGNDRDIQMNKIVVGKNSNGVPQVFGIGIDNIIYHKSVDTVAVENMEENPHVEICSDYASFSGSYLDISVCSNSDGRLEVFAIKRENISDPITGNVYHIWEKSSGGWEANWELLAFDSYNISVLSILDQSKNGRIHVFSLDSTGYVKHRWQTAPNNGWSNNRAYYLNGMLPNVPHMKKIAIARNKDNRIEVFGLGMNDGKIYHAWQTTAGANNNFTEWKLLINTNNNTELAVGTNQDGRLEVFFGKDGKVFNKWQVAPNGGWSSSDIKEIPVDKQAKGIRELFTGNDNMGRVFVFGKAEVDKLIWHAWQKTPNHGPWLGWLVI